MSDGIVYYSLAKTGLDKLLVDRRSIFGSLHSFVHRPIIFIVLFLYCTSPGRIGSDRLYHADEFVPH